MIDLGKIIIFLLIGAFCGVMFRRCNKPVYEQGCKTICYMNGHDTGFMRDNYSCQCEGFRFKPEKKIIKP